MADAGPTDISVRARVIDVYPYRVRDGGSEFLLLRRAQGRMYAGEWRMVGGKIERGEQAWQAAVRELWEETGQYPQRLWTIPSLNAFYEWRQDRINLIPAFAAELAQAPQLDAEHDRYEWVPREAAVERLMWPEQARLIGLAAEMIRRGIPSALEIDVGGSPSSRTA